jgi:hypothetical protein
MTVEVKQQRTDRYTGVFVEDKNGERRWATKSFVTIKFETDEGATLTRTYQGPELGAPIEEDDEVRSLEELFEPAEHMMDYISEQHAGRGNDEKVRFNASWNDSETVGQIYDPDDPADTSPIDAQWRQMFLNAAYERIMHSGKWFDAGFETSICTSLAEAFRTVDAVPLDSSEVGKEAKMAEVVKVAGLDDTD